MTLLARVASDTVIDAAYQWLCQRRRQYPPNADVWQLRQQWAQHKQCIQADLAAGRYRFAPLERVQRQDQDAIDLWSARDALVMKALTLVLSDVLPVSPRCTHIKGNGGSNYALQDVLRELPRHRFVLRTDVKSYYASIDHLKALELLAAYIKDKAVLNLLCQTMRRTRTWGGLFRDYTQGISRGCALSPLLGAFFLHTLDQRLEKTGLFYVRFMDDIVVLAPTRWKLRKAVALVNQELDTLALEKHPDKTFIGRINKGFDFLGFHISPTTVFPATHTVQQFRANRVRLYEQGASPRRIEHYQHRWRGWVKGMLGDRVSPNIVPWHLNRADQASLCGGVGVGGMG